MRVPVYPRGSDPRSARRILSKSLSYAQEEVRNCRADWVDPADPRKGIVPREFLASGKVFAAAPSDLADLKRRFVANVRYRQPDRPTNYTNNDIAAVRIHAKSVVQRTWDWQMEPATA